MISPKKRFLKSSTMLILFLALLVYSQTGSKLPRNQNPVPDRAAGEPFIGSNAGLIALHDANSPRYNLDCLSVGCHSEILNRVTLNPKIPEAHQVVARMDLNPQDCFLCHDSVEIVRGMQQSRGNAGSVGKNVDVQSKCANCHGNLPEGRPLYMK